MILAAAGGGEIVLLLVMAVIALINWVVGKLKEGNQPPPNQSTPPPRDTAAPRRGNPETEDERMRRFLEALGVPTGEDAPPPRPAPRPRAEQRPVPPIVAPPPIPALPRRPRSAPVPPPIEPEWHPTSLDELPAPVARAEQISIPELRSEPMPEFATVSSRVAAATPVFPTAGEEFAPAGPSIGDTLRAALASPQQLRSAFVLSEVFGTPPGLR